MTSKRAKRKIISLRRRLPVVASLVITLIVCANVALFADSGLQDLTITASFGGGRPIGPRDRIELRLSRPLTASEGRIAMLIGRTDISSLLVAAGDALAYDPKLLPLPAGENQVFVYLVSADNAWKQIAEFTLRVGGARPAQADSQNRPPATSKQSDGAPTQGTTAPNGASRKWGFDKADLTPSLTVGVKSQAAESHFPDSNRPQRPTFTDSTLQGSFKTEMARGLLNSQTQFDVAGSSFRNEALRFGQLGDKAPRVDLASYLMQFQAGKARYLVGHTSFGTNRHLINNFSSRGMTLTLPITSRADVSLAAMNGTSIVGFDNFFGIAKRRHQLLSGTVGMEFNPKRPGAARLEASMLDGWVQPVSGFNQRNVNDAERSRGVGFRFLASDPSGRLRLDSGFARSKFINPADSLLSQGADLVPIPVLGRNARYIDASYELLRNVSLTKEKKASLALTYRHERVDPLYRSLGASTQADKLQNDFQLNATIGEVTAQFVHVRFNDNLRNIPSVLKSLTRSNSLSVAAPMASLFATRNGSPAWLPRLSYNLVRTHQFGASIPTRGGFELDPGTVPDLLATNHSLTADWQVQKWRIAYRLNQSIQNNQQPGRELSDFINLVNGVTVGISPAPTLDLNLDLNFESANNREARRLDRTFRIAPVINWRMSKRAALAANLSATLVGNDAGTARNRSAELDLLWSYRFSVERDKFRKVQTNFFIRYANRYAFSRDRVAGFNQLVKLQTLNTGLSFTFF